MSFATTDFRTADEGSVTLIGLGACRLPCKSSPYVLLHGKGDDWRHLKEDKVVAYASRNRASPDSSLPNEIIIREYDPSTETREVVFPRNPPSAEAFESFGSSNPANFLPSHAGIQTRLDLEGIKVPTGMDLMSGTSGMSSGESWYIRNTNIETGKCVSTLFDHVTRMPDEDRPEGIPSDHSCWIIGHLAVSEPYMLDEEARVADKPPTYGESPADSSAAGPPPKYTE